MTVLARLAWRNIWRNRRRSVITISSISLGLAAILFGQSLIKTIQFQLIEKATGVITGHLQVFEASVDDYKFPEKAIARAKEVEAALQADDAIAAFEPRIMLTGLVSSKTDSKGVLLCGVDPEREPRVLGFAGYLSQGKFLSGPRDIVMGDHLARTLGLKLGDEAVVLAQAFDGSMGADKYRLVGIVHTGSQTFDGQIVHVALPAFRSMLALEGGANDFVVRLKDPDKLQEARARLAERLKGLGVKVATWRDVDHELVGIQRYQNAVMTIMLIVVFVIVALGILNTLLMSTLDRVREFGVLMAIGARPGWITSLVFLESAFMGLLGLSLGWSGGSGLIAYYHKAGLAIPLRDALGYFLPFDTMLYLRFVWARHLTALFGVMASSILSAVVPAVWASRLKPAEALRQL